MQIAQSYLHAKLQRPSEGRNNWIRGVKGNFTHNLNTIIVTVYRTVSYNYSHARYELVVKLLVRTKITSKVYVST